MRRGAKPAKARVSRKSRKNGGSGVSDLDKRLAEALDQQMAAAEILRVISASPTDVEPVFRAIARSATKLCDARFGTVFRFDGEMITVAANQDLTPEEIAVTNAVFPARATRGTAAGRAIVERRAVHISDIRGDPDYVASPALNALGYRTALAVPLLREGSPIGVFVMWRREVRPFADTHVELLKTFAAQAVIAIENARLFNETKTALEQQTATGEILRVISASPTDIQPVFDTIVRNAVRLCDGFFGIAFRYDGHELSIVAHHNFSPRAVEIIARSYPAAPGPEAMAGRAVLRREVIHVSDVTTPGPDTGPRSQQLGNELGYRAFLSVPMLRHGEPIGVINVTRREPRPFTDKQIALVKTFADQAVIAIENVRLFTELQEKNRALTQAHAQVTEALEQQTATSEILRVMSSSPTDVQPVFDAIADSAARLTGAVIATVYEFDGSLIHLRVLVPADWPHADEFRRNFPRPPSADFAAGRVILGRTVLHRADLWTDPDTPDLTREWARRMDLRSVLWVPMLREGEPIGVIGAVRRESGFFSDEQVRLLQTFADQAVIAIENVRLFTELQARTQQLTRSVAQLTALGEVGRAVSSTLDLATVLTTIVSRAVHLAGLEAGAIYEYDEAAEVFYLRATQNLPEEFLEIAGPLALPKGEGATGQLAVTREPVQISDIAAPDAYHGRMRDVLLRLGHRALLAVPLISEDHIVGGLVVNRRQPGEFAPEVIDLLRTFATQSALAIQNARLFREIKDKGRQLEVASQHKSEFLANMSHELRTPLNAIIGFSEVLIERMFGELNEKQAEYLKDIYASGTHLLSLINDILDLSKIEAGRMELELTDFDLPTALDSALTLVRERAGRRGITLEAAVDQQLGEVQADERKIRQVVLNLLSNAIKFTPEGGRIEVRAASVTGSAEVSVSDTGIGIAPEDQEAVFEEFRQVGTSAAKQEGTGLGLTLCRKYIELHGGKIWVRSQVGVGSTFTFTIPTRRIE